MDCGGRFPPECMDFDHRSDKRINMGNLKVRDPEKIQQEAMKCDVVCSNCHRIRTWRTVGIV